MSAAAVAVATPCCPARFRQLGVFCPFFGKQSLTKHVVDLLPELPKWDEGFVDFIH